MVSLDSKVTWVSRETGVIAELQVLVEKMDQKGQRANQDPSGIQDLLV